MILSPEVLEQTLINLKAIEVAPHPPPIYLRSKAWSGLITKQVINAISALAMKCVLNGIDRLVPEDDNVSVNSKPDHHPGRPLRIRMFSLPGGGLDFESEKFSTVFKDKWRNFSICSKKLGAA